MPHAILMMAADNILRIRYNPSRPKSQKKRHCEISAPDIPRIIPRGYVGRTFLARTLVWQSRGSSRSLPESSFAFPLHFCPPPPTFKTTCTAQPHTPPPFSHIKRRAEERIPRPCVSVSKKSPRPAALSSFLNLISSENCLMERERGPLPLSLYPRCSIMELHFIVF